MESEGQSERIGWRDFGIHLIEIHSHILILITRRTVLIEGGSHGAVAFAQRVHMTQGDGQKNGVVEDVSHVQEAVAVGDDQEIVGSVVIIIAIFHHNMILRIHLMIQGIKATVARNLQHPFDGESAIVELILLYKVEMDVYVCGEDIAVFHIFEKLGIDLEILLMVPVGQGSKLNFICRELSHC